jgi:tight adherence protein B
MGMIIGLTFVGVFAIVAIPLMLVTAGQAKASRQAVATLDAAVKIQKSEPARTKVLDVRKQEIFSSIPWLNKKLREMELTPYLRRTLEQAKLDWSLGRLGMMTLACFVVPSCIVYVRFGMILPALAAGIGPAGLPFGFVIFRRGRRFGKMEEGLPEALDLMVSALRAGHSLIAAMSLVARECADPVGPEFKICFEEQNYGLELKNALENLIMRVPLQDVNMFATAVLIQKESGGNLAEVLDKTSYLIRERFRLKRQVRTHTAQGRLTGLILTFLPVALGFAMYCLNPEMMSILWKRDIGIKMIWTAVGMTVLGGYIINRIVDIDV